MRREFLTVDDVFEISGRGIVVTGNLNRNSPSCKIGNTVILVHPDGQELTTKVSGIEHIKPVNIKDFTWNKIGIMFKDVGKKDDVPIGTKVFSEISE